MIDDKEYEFMEELFHNCFLNINLGWEYQWKVVILSLIVLICCNTNVTGQILNVVGHI